MSNLRDIRKLRGLSQAQLAARAGVSTSRISVQERKGIHDIRTAKKLGVILNCNPLFLLDELNKI